MGISRAESMRLKRLDEELRRRDLEHSEAEMTQACSAFVGLYQRYRALQLQYRSLYKRATGREPPIDLQRSRFLSTPLMARMLYRYAQEQAATQTAE